VTPESDDEGASSILDKIAWEAEVEGGGRVLLRERAGWIEVPVGERRRESDISSRISWNALVGLGPVRVRVRATAISSFRWS